MKSNSLMPIFSKEKPLRGIFVAVLTIAAFSVLFEVIFSTVSREYSTDQILEKALTDEYLKGYQIEDHNFKVVKESVSLVSNEHLLILKTKDQSQIHIRSRMVDGDLKILSVEILH